MLGKLRDRLIARLRQRLERLLELNDRAIKYHEAKLNEIRSRSDD